MRDVPNKIRAAILATIIAPGASCESTCTAEDNRRLVEAVLYRYRAEKPGKQQKSTSSTSRTMRNRKKNAVPITFSAAC